MRAIVLILLGGAVYIGANMWLDSYREHHAAEEVAQVLNSPAAMNASLDQIAEGTQQLCMAKGYSEAYCKKLLSN